jgi:hypothetical protein
MALAQQRRLADGAEHAAGEHVEAALDELGIEAERRDLPDAATGREFE